MNWEDEGFLLSKRKFRENAVIVNIFAKTKGKINGIVYGGNSRKIRNLLQTGNKMYFFYTAKSENKIGYLKTELLEAISPKYFDDKKRTTCILSITSILNSLLPESQSNIKIYQHFEEFLSNCSKSNWILYYIFLELNLIKELGFGIDFNNLKISSRELNSIGEIIVDDTKYQIPFFLSLNRIPETMSSDLIKKSLSFNRLLMLNKFFLPNNLIFPRSRVLFENYFN